jgi:DNA primase
VDLVGFLRITGYNRKDPLHTIRALELLEERWEAGVVIVEKQVRLDGDEFQHFLPAGPEVIQYAATRGLTDTTMWKFKLGSWRQFMTMPNFEEGKLVGIKLRRIEPGEPRFFSLKGSKQGLFNYDAVEFNTGVVLIVKGEIPCMLLDQMGYTACAPTGGEGSWRLVERWKVALALAKKIVIGDNDDAGRKLGLRRSELLGGKLVFPPEHFKDIDAFILADKDAAVETINSWIEEIRDAN